MTTHALLQRLPLEALDATNEDGGAAPVVGVGQDLRCGDGFQKMHRWRQYVLRLRRGLQLDQIGRRFRRQCQELGFQHREGPRPSFDGILLRDEVALQLFALIRARSTHTSARALPYGPTPCSCANDEAVHAVANIECATSFAQEHLFLNELSNAPD
jgi:hypothetical protein